MPQYHASLLTLTRQEQKLFSHVKGDTEGFVNIPLQIKGAKLSISLREDTEKPGCIRVSLRSVDDFPCNKMAAEFFNGGGHLNASGGELRCSMEEAEEIVSKALARYAPLLA
jgi:phosphoesterase RecJ-like protein